MVGVRAAAAAAALLTAALPTASPAQMRQHHRLTHQPASTPPPHAEKSAGRPQRTVMSWVTADPSGSAHHPWNLTADFVLHGPARGAVNAISLSAGWEWRLLENGTLAFVADAQLTAEMQRVWQSSAARAAGLRLYPEIGPPGDIHALRKMFKAPNRPELIAAAAQQVARTGVAGINIDFEPDVDARNRSNPLNPTRADGLAFASFLGELSDALRALPGSPIVTMDSLSVGSACWSAPPAGTNHTWDRLPCPWIRRYAPLRPSPPPGCLLPFHRRERLVPTDLQVAAGSGTLTRWRRARSTSSSRWTPTISTRLPSTGICTSTRSTLTSRGSASDCSRSRA